MDAVTLDRDEWVAVARELDSTYRQSAPPGLRSRIEDLLERVPPGWEHEPCTLELDGAAADVVRAIVRRGRGLPDHPGLRRSQGDALHEAEGIIHDHQRPLEDR